MIIVAGHLRVDPVERPLYLDRCRPIIEAARATDGCLDFHVSGDPIEPDRVNIYEFWVSEAAVETFRGDGPDTGQAELIRSADVSQFEVSNATLLI